MIITKEQAIAIQQKHLKLWKKRLKTKYFIKLKEWAESTNDEIENGYQIRRGQNLTEFVFNSADYVHFLT